MRGCDVPRLCTATVALLNAQLNTSQYLVLPSIAKYLIRGKANSQEILNNLAEKIEVRAAFHSQHVLCSASIAATAFRALGVRYAATEKKCSADDQNWSFYFAARLLGPLTTSQPPLILQSGVHSRHWMRITTPSTEQLLGTRLRHLA